MKEYSSSINREALSRGLRRDARASINGVGISVLQNLKPTEYGLVPHSSVNNYIEDAAIDFPFPQLFRGEAVTLLCFSNEIYTVDESNWSISLLTTYDAVSRSTTRDIVAGSVWQFVDMKRSWMLTNGSCVVFRASYDLVEDDEEDRVYVSTNCVPASICLYKGRVVSLGFPDIEDHAVYGTLGENMMTFSSVGGGDVFWNYMTDKKPTTLSGTYLEKNDFGFAMVGKGCGYACLSLGEYVLFYTENSIYVGKHEFNPVASPPVSTIGIKKLLNVGIKSRGAVGGDDKQHVFIDSSGALWTIGADLSITRLGYGEFFSEFEECEDCVISLDSNEREFYICNSSVGYVLTPTGLGQLATIYSSIYSTKEGLIGIDTDLEDVDTQEVEFGPLDFGIRAIKKVESVELGISGVTSAYVKVFSRYSSGGTQYEGSWVPVNSRGFAVPHKSGVEFNIRIKGVWAADAQLSYLTVRWKLEDKVGIRGTTGVDQT